MSLLGGDKVCESLEAYEVLYRYELLWTAPQAGLGLLLGTGLGRQDWGRQALRSL